MGVQTVVLNNGAQAIINRDINKIFGFGNNTKSATLTNSTGGSITYLAGSVVGKIGSSGVLTRFTSAAVDGSQNPIGVLFEDITLSAGASAVVNYVTQGDVEESKLVFQGADTLETVISNRRVREILETNSQIRLTTSTDLTNFDNN